MGVGPTELVIIAIFVVALVFLLYKQKQILRHRHIAARNREKFHSINASAVPTNWAEEDDSRFAPMQGVEFYSGDKNDNLTALTAAGQGAGAIGEARAYNPAIGVVPPPPIRNPNRDTSITFF